MTDSICNLTRHPLSLVVNYICSEWTLFTEQADVIFHCLASLHEALQLTPLKSLLLNRSWEGETGKRTFDGFCKGPVTDNHQLYEETHVLGTIGKFGIGRCLQVFMSLRSQKKSNFSFCPP